MFSIALSWPVLVVCALLTGAACVAILVVKRQLEPVAALVGVSAFAGSIWALSAIARGYGRADSVVYALAFMLGGLAGGWSLAASALDRQDASPSPRLDEVPNLDRRGGTAVVLVADVEMREYETSETARMLRRIADDELINLTLATIPFFFFAQKARYRAVGGVSPAYQELRALSDRVSSRLADVAAVDFATCSGELALDKRVGRIARSGFDTVIIAELAVEETPALSDAKRQTDALRLGDHGIRVAYTGPLGHSEQLVAMALRRIMQVTQDPSTTGIVLLGAGRPNGQGRGRVHDAENALLNLVRARLLDAGLDMTRVRVAWTEWQQPDITSTVRHLAALGCTRIVVAPAAFPLDTITTVLDTELAIHQARIDPSIPVITLPAWGDDPQVAHEMGERIAAAL